MSVNVIISGTRSLLEKDVSNLFGFEKWHNVIGLFADRHVREIRLC